MNELIIEKATELAKIIKEDKRTQRMLIANIAFEASLGLKSKMESFSKERDKLLEMISGGAAKEEMDPMSEAVKKMYEEIMSDPVMMEYDTARREFEGILAQVDSIINYEITGEESADGCGGSGCEGCSGCSGR